MTDGPMFVLPQSMILLVIMQFLAAFIGWWFKRPLLPAISSGLLTGTVFGWVFFQFMPTTGGAPLAFIMGAVVTCCYCAVMQRALGQH